jgi:hypothetical protein
MKNSQRPAYPTKVALYKGEPLECSQTSDGTGIFPGLTKRERFAMAAMQGVVAGFDPESKANGCFIPEYQYPELMKQCVQMADELLKQLSE